MASWLGAKGTGYGKRRDSVRLMGVSGANIEEAGAVSVVVITRNRREELMANLSRLVTLGLPVIVVDNGSTDGTPEAVTDAFPSVRVLAVGRNMGAAGRNVGVAAASTPYVAFADDDSWWEEGSLERAAALFEQHPRLGLVAGKVVVGKDGFVDPTCVAMANSPLPHAPDLPGRPVLGFIACGAVVRKEAFAGVGGFDEMLGVGGEEVHLATELAVAGWGLCYVPDVVAVHSPSPTRNRQLRRRRVARNDLWQVWLRRRLPTVVIVTGRTVRRGLRDRAVLQGSLDAARALPVILRRRRPVPPEIERLLRLQDDGHG